MSARSITTAIGLGLCAAALSVGSAVAAPQTPAARDPYPASDGWQTWDYDFEVPAGSACDVAVRVQIRGHIRFTVNGEPLVDDHQPQPGDVFRGQTPDVSYTLRNQTTRQRANLPASPRRYREQVSADGAQLNGRSVGPNVLFGPGVRGILWVDGTQRYTYQNLLTDQETLDIHSTTGRTVEMCHRLGALAVDGKRF